MKQLAIILTILGFFLIIFGILQKILHTPNANINLQLGMIIEILGIVLICITQYNKHKKEEEQFRK